MPRFNISGLITMGAVAAGLVLAPFGVAAVASAEPPDRPGYMECIDQQPDGDDGREDDYTIQTCCVLHNGTVEDDVLTGAHWCNIPAVEVEQEQTTPTPWKPPALSGAPILPLAPGADSGPNPAVKSPAARMPAATMR